MEGGRTAKSEVLAESEPHSSIWGQKHLVSMTALLGRAVLSSLFLFSSGLIANNHYDQDLKDDRNAKVRTECTSRG